MLPIRHLRFIPTGGSKFANRSTFDCAMHVHHPNPDFRWLVVDAQIAQRDLSQGGPD